MLKLEEAILENNLQGYNFEVGQVLFDESYIFLFLNNFQNYLKEKKEKYFIEKDLAFIFSLKILIFHQLPFRKIEVLYFIFHYV
jgi:hypothetical protein